MSHPVRRLLVVTLALLLPLIASPEADAARDPSGAAGRVVGGTVVGIQSAPWQVYLEIGSAACGGSILTPTTVLTAAHCVQDAKVGVPTEQGGIGILAGLSNLETLPIPSTDKPQYREASALRIHPSWARNASTTGDVAVITFLNPLVLDGVTARAVALPPLGQVPVGDELMGTRLSVSGYGVNNSGFPQNLDGALRSASVIVADPAFCDVPENAVTVCGYNRIGSSCQGDSGGPLVIPPTVAGAAPIQVGVVSNGPIGCPAGAPDYYASLWAPEVRAFIDGVAPVPVAPRLGALNLTMSGAPNVREGETVTCAPATFIGATSTRTKLSANDAIVATADNGPASFTLTAAQVGQTISCRSYGFSAGGIAVSTRRGYYGRPVTAAPAPPPPVVVPVTCAPSKEPFYITGPSTARRGTWIEFRASGRRVAVAATELSTASTVFRKPGQSQPPAVVSAGAVKYEEPPKGTVLMYVSKVHVRVPYWAKIGKKYKLQVTTATRAGSAKSGGPICNSWTKTFKVKVTRR